MPGPCDLPGAGTLCDAAGSAAGSAAQGVAGNFIDEAAKTFSEALGKLASTLLTFWTSVDTPNLQDPSGPVAFLRSSTSWLAAFILIISLIIVGAKMAITSSFEPGREAAGGVWQMVLFTGAGIPGIALLGIAGDQFADWIIDRASGGDLGGRIADLFNMDPLHMMGSGLVLIMAVLGIFSALAQMFLMIARIGMLVLLAGMLPMSAAAAVSKGGKQWFSKTLGWLLAFAAYKPAAAIIYAAAFALVGKGKDPVTIMSGLMLITLSVLALPALLRLAVPATAAIASGAAGAGSAAGAGQMATGAMQLKGASGGGSGKDSGGGGSSSSGPSGSSKTPAGSSGTGSGGGAASGGGSSSAAGAGQAGTASTTGAAGASSGGAASAGSAAGAGAGAGAVAGPAGAAVGATIGAVKAGTQSVRSAGENAASTDQQGNGPTGSEGNQ